MSDSGALLMLPGVFVKVASLQIDRLGLHILSCTR